MVSALLRALVSLMHPKMLLLLILPLAIALVLWLALALNDVAAGQVHVLFGTLVSGLPYIRSRRVRLIAVTTPHRLKGYPDVPTVIESGVPGYLSSGWMGLMAPARTPKPILDKLLATLTKAVDMPATKELFERQGADPATGTPAEFKKFVAEEYARFTQAIKLANLKPE